MGEPLAGRLSAPDGVAFVSVAIGNPAQEVLLLSNAGYGFRSSFEGLYAKNKAGKSMLSVPEGAQAMTLVPVDQPEQTEVACLTTAGQLLVFKLEELPQLPRGKGVKLVQIPGNKFKSGEETLKAVVLLSPGRSLKVFAGNRHLTIKGRDLDAYRGERGKRGGRLPRGFQRVEGLEVID